MTSTSPATRLRRLLRHLPLLLGPAALVALFATFGVGEILTALASADPRFVAAAMVLTVPALMLRSLRWKVLLARDGDGLGYGEVTAVFAYAVFIGMPTPGRIGEFYKIVHLRNRGIPVGRALASVLLDRILDVAMLVVVGASAVVLLLGGDERATAGAIVAGFAAALLGARALVCGTPGEILGRWLGPVAPGRLVERVRTLRADLCGALGDLGAREHLLSAALTVAAWSTNYLAAWLLARALGLPLSVVDAAGISAVGSLASFLPISVMGAGTRDLAVVALLALYGVGRAEALAFSTLLLSFNVATALVCAYSLATPHIRRRGPTRRAGGEDRPSPSPATAAPPQQEPGEG